MLAIVLVLDGMLVSLPNKVFILARMDAWLSYVVAMLMVLLSMWLLARVLERFPDKDLFEALVYRFPVIGRILALPFIFCMFIMLIRDIRTLTEFVSIELLSITPLTMICVMLVLPIMVMARSGLEIVARMVELWLPMMIIIVASLPFFLFPEFELRHLLPFFDRGLVPPLQGSWYAMAYMGQILFLPFLVSQSTFSFKDGLMSLAIATGMILWINFTILLSMGGGMATKMLFPFYETVRLIRVTDFLDRFDLPLNLVYLPLMIIKDALLFFAITYGLNRLLPSLQMKEMTVSFGAWCFVCSFWFFKNATELFQFIRSWSAIAVLCEMLLPVLFFFLLRPPKTDSGSPQGEPSGSNSSGQPQAEGPQPQGASG